MNKMPPLEYTENKLKLLELRCQIEEIKSIMSDRMIKFWISEDGIFVSAMRLELEKRQLMYSELSKKLELESKEESK